MIIIESFTARTLGGDTGRRRIRPTSRIGACPSDVVSSDVTHGYAIERARQREIPASTFKIVNSLIGVAVWNRDQTLRTAIEHSAVWAYQEWARRVGPAAMAEFVLATGYGNGDPTEAQLDRFWLDGPLAISALEQLDLLERLVEGDLPFRP